MTSSASPKSVAQVASFRAALREARHPVALAGAGLSAASGVPTFRGQDGGALWRRHDMMSLATPSAFRSDPSKVWQFYHWRRELCLRAQPNAAHMALAGLATDEIGKQVFPNAQSGFSLVTQNVDGLSTRAAQAVAYMQPRPTIEMHGSLFRIRCTKCNKETSNFDSPISQSLRGTEDQTLDYRAIGLKDLPRCQDSKCGGLSRPGVVWFGESIPALRAIELLLQPCDLLLVLGTSSTVMPAASFAAQVHSSRGRTAVFNLENTGERSDWFFEGPVEETLPWALGVEEQVRQ